MSRVAVLMIGVLCGVAALLLVVRELSTRRGGVASVTAERLREQDTLTVAGLIVARSVSGKDAEVVADIIPAVKAAEKKARAHLRPVATMRVTGSVTTPGPTGGDSYCLVRGGEALQLSLDAALMRAPAGSVVLAGDIVMAVRGVEVARAEIKEGSVMLVEEPQQSLRGGWYWIGSAVLTPRGPAYGAGVGHSWIVGGARVAIGAWGAYGSRAGQLLGAQIEVGR